MKIKEYKNGVFCYSELSTVEYENSKEFYKNIFDWNIKENNEFLEYTVFCKNDNILLGMYDSDDEQLEIDFSNTWTPFISVTDIEKTIERVVKNGGECLQESFEADNYGKAAIIKDPTGALISLWQANEYIGSELQREENTMSWCELYTTDIKTASEFYKKVFLWKAEPFKIENELYMNFKKGSSYVAGMREIEKEIGIKKSIWVMYIEVENCKKIYKKALKLGAKKVQDPTVNKENFGFVETAILRDISGAIFAIGQKLY